MLSALVRQSRHLGKLAVRSKYTQAPLPYALNALEPHISEKIMDLHYNKHHKTYVTNLNNAAEELAAAVEAEDIASQVRLHQAIRFNGGGNLNHELFWNNMASPSDGGGALPAGGAIESAIVSTFGSFDNFQAAFKAKSLGVQGSGWCWLAYDTAVKSVVIATTANQDPLESTTGLKPLLGVDVWEHAYYLDYENRRPDYIDNIWPVINWNEVETRLKAASA
eukprot:m.193711 g.193711  ORF g.193711 m.193711 type:complete len:222 (+) comp16984_c0_seq1:46-711(+)